MMYVKGKVISSASRKIVSKKNGQSYTFWTSYVHNELTGRPIPVEVGDTPLESGVIYRIPVYVRPYPSRGGVDYQLGTYKDHPPQKVAAKTA